MTRQQIDITLIHRAKQKDQKAFCLLFSYYYPQVYYYINSIIKSPTDTEDLTMITIEKAFAKLDRYQPLYTFKAWIFKIARNAGIDFLNSHPFTVDITEASKIKSQIENPEQQIIRTETTENVLKIVNNLPEHYKKSSKSLLF